MGLKSALIWWNKKGGILDHDDVMFVAGYQKALEDSSNLVLTLANNTQEEAARRIRCMDDLDMPMGN